MAVRVVLHGKVLDPFLLAVKSVLDKRGIAVVEDAGFGVQDLHFITGPGPAGDNIVRVTPLPVAPYRALDHPALRQSFQAEAIPYAQAKGLFEDLRADHANGKRYAVTDLPDLMLAVCIAADDDNPAHIATTHRMITDALRSKRSVVLVAEDPMDSGRLAQFANHHPSVIIYHDMLADLLHKTDAVISRAGAGVILAHIHRTPAVLFSPAPFDHISPVVSTEVPFDAALAQALATEGVYAKYLYWYFQTQALRADHPDFADRLIALLDKLGIAVEQPGLDVKAGFVRTLANTHDAAQTLNQFLAEQPEIATFRLTKTLKVSEMSWVFQARINGEKAVIKRFLGDDAAHTVRSLQEELAFVGGKLGQGPYLVNRCLFAWPDAGTVVLSHAGGIRMYDAIAAATAPERATLLRKAGGWLNAYASLRTRRTSFGPRHWVKDLAGRPRHLLGQEAQTLFDAGLVSLSQLAQQTMGTHVVQAATHGDYAGINVHYDQGKVIGVDIQGECWQALAKDAARFVVWQALQDPYVTDARRFGINHQDYEAFFSGLPLLDAEHTTTIPFFIGWNMMYRLIEKAEAMRDCLPEQRLLAAYFADLPADLESKGRERLSNS